MKTSKSAESKTLTKPRVDVLIDTDKSLKQEVINKMTLGDDIF